MLPHLIKQAREDEDNQSLRTEKAENLPRMDSSRGKKVPARPIFKIGTILTADSTEVSQAQLCVRTKCSIPNIHTYSLHIKKAGFACLSEQLVDLSQ